MFQHYKLKLFVFIFNNNKFIVINLYSLCCIKKLLHRELAIEFFQVSLHLEVNHQVEKWFKEGRMITVKRITNYEIFVCDASQADASVFSCSCLFSLSGIPFLLTKTSKCFLDYVLLSNRM